MNATWYIFSVYIFFLFLCYFKANRDISKFVDKYKITQLQQCLKCWKKVEHAKIHFALIKLPARLKEFCRLQSWWLNIQLLCLMNYGWYNKCYIFCFNCCCRRNCKRKVVVMSGKRKHHLKSGCLTLSRYIFW